MAKHRRGLHKEIRSIFGGVPTQRDDGTPQQPCPPPPDRSVDDDREKVNEPPWKAPAASRPPAPQTRIPKLPQTQPSVQMPPKVVPSEPPKSRTITKQGGHAPWRQSWKKIQNKLFASRPGVNMRRQTTMAILVPVLLIVFILVFSRVLTGPKGGAPIPANHIQTNAVAASIVEIHWKIPEPYPLTLRDPMQSRPAHSSQGGPTHPDPNHTETDQIVVTGILFDDNPSVAIGNQILHENDKIFGATIVKINTDSVEFEMNGKTWTQKVRP